MSLTESLSGGHAKGHGAPLQHGDGVFKHHHPGSGGRAHTAAKQNPVADAGLRGPAQHKDEAGGRDRNIPTAAGWWRLQVRRIVFLSFRSLKVETTWKLTEY